MAIALSVCWVQTNRMDVSKYRNSDTHPIFDWPLASNNFNQSEIERKNKIVNELYTL